jgi:hypothetical protein
VLEGSACRVLVKELGQDLHLGRLGHGPHPGTGLRRWGTRDRASA